MKTDSNLKHQLDLTVRRIAIVVLMTTSWPRIRRAVEIVVQAIDDTAEQGYTEVPVP